MADKILMNKNTLAALKVELKEYKDALPVFEMKEQQLMEAVLRIEQNIARLEEVIERNNSQTRTWVAVMAEHTIDLSEMIVVNSVDTRTKEVAGVPVQIFENLSFEELEIDLMETPLWLDKAIEVLREQRTNYTLIKIEEENMALLAEELAEARRMKNALKEVFIPETKDNIRKIEIYLGDVERLAIGCAKLVKKKKQDKKELA